MSTISDVLGDRIREGFSYASSWPRQVKARSVLRDRAVDSSSLFNRLPGQSLQSVSTWPSRIFHNVGESIANAFSWLIHLPVRALRAIGHWFSRIFHNIGQSIEKAFSWLIHLPVRALRAIGQWISHAVNVLFTGFATGLKYIGITFLVLIGTVAFVQLVRYVIFPGLTRVIHEAIQRKRERVIQRELEAYLRNLERLEEERCQCEERRKEEERRRQQEIRDAEERRRRQQQQEEQRQQQRKAAQEQQQRRNRLHTQLKGLQNWKSALEAAVKNRGKDRKSFPEPPFKYCERCPDKCECHIADYLSVLEPGREKFLKEVRNMAHPDMYTACDEIFKDAIEGEASRMFQILRSIEKP